MVADYQAIPAGDYKRCGTEIERIGLMLLADRYHHRTHFNFALLEKAEDAGVTRRCRYLRSSISASEARAILIDSDS
jgi:hypothetical protein